MCFVLALRWMLFNRNCVGTVNTATLVSFTHFSRWYLPPNYGLFAPKTICSREWKVPGVELSLPGTFAFSLPETFVPTNEYSKE